MMTGRVSISTYDIITARMFGTVCMMTHESDECL